MAETPGVLEVTSRANPFLKTLRDVEHGKGVKRHGLTLVAGDRHVREALTSVPSQCRAWLTPGESEPPPPGTSSTVTWYQLAPELYRELDWFGTRRPLLAVAVPEMPAWNVEAPLEEGVTLLVPFQDPENVGAVIRSAMAFGVTRTVLLAESAHPFHAKSVRASAGAVFRASLSRGPALADLPVSGSVLALSGEGSPLPATRFPERFALLAGLEGPGLPDAWRQQSVAIPMEPGAESLNAAAAVAVALYAWKAAGG